MGAEVASDRGFAEGQHHQEAAYGGRVTGGASAGGGALREDSAQAEDAEDSGGIVGTWVVWGVV